jgi:hypothetical protein
MVLAQNFAQDVEAGKKGTANPNNNTYTSDWLDGLIGPGGLLLLLLLVPDL